MMEMIKSMAFSFTSVAPPTPPRTPNSNYTSSSFLLSHNLTAAAAPPPPNKSKQLSSCIFLVSTSSFSSFRSPAEKTPSQGSTEGQEIATEEEDTPRPSFSRSSSSSARIQIDLLDQLTGSTADGYENAEKQTIRQQLANLVGDRDEDFTIPLGKNLKKVSAAFLTISQKRNIKRQAYLTEVSQRNDSVFFATIGAFIILPPFVILGIAIATGYVQLFP